MITQKHLIAGAIIHVFRIHRFRQVYLLLYKRLIKLITLYHMDFVSWHCLCVVYSVPTDVFPLISLLWHIQGMLGRFRPSCCPLAEWEDWFHHGQERSLKISHIHNGRTVMLSSHCKTAFKKKSKIFERFSHSKLN